MTNNQSHPMQHALAVVRTFLHATIIDDVQQNRIRLTGLPPLIQLLGAVIIGLLCITTGLMVFASQLRAQFQIIVIATESYPNGLLLPSTVIGLVLFLLCMAWSFLLVAIQHSAWWIRVSGIFVHLFMMGTWSINLAQTELWLFGLIMGVMAIQTLLLLRRPHTHLVGNWVVIALCESILLALPHSIYLQQYQVSGIGLLFTSVANFIQSQFAFITPMLFLVGISMAQAALNISDWGRHTAQQVSSQTLIGLLGICIVWRLLLIHDPKLPNWSSIACLVLYTAGFIGIAYSVYLAHPQLSITSQDVNDTLEREAPWMIVAHLAPLIIQIIVINIMGLFAMIATVIGYDLSATLDVLSSTITDRSSEIQLAVAGFIMVYAGIIWRRGAHLRGVFFGITAYHLAWRTALNYYGIIVPNTLIEHVFFGGALIYATVRLLRGRLTTAQLQGFLFITICSLLLLNADFLNNPLSPVLGFAGIVFIAFGVFWDVLFGSSWVNRDSAHYPRPIRLFFYLGYCLLMTILAFWAVLSQATGMTNLLTGEVALLAMHTFATPLLHLFYFFVLLWPPVIHPHVSTTHEPHAI